MPLLQPYFRIPPPPLFVESWGGKGGGERREEWLVLGRCGTHSEQHCIVMMDDGACEGFGDQETALPFGRVFQTWLAVPISGEGEETFSCNDEGQMEE